MHRGPAQRTPFLAILLALPLILGGCASSGGASDGPSASANAPGTTTDTRPAHRRLGYRLEWRTTPVTARSAKIADVSVFDDILTVRDSSNTLSVIEVANGVNRWASEVAQPLTVVHGIARTQSGEILVSTDVELTLHDPKAGTLNDRQQYALLTATKPVVMGRLVVVGGENGQLLVHNLSSGYRQHAYDFGARFDAPPVAIGENAVGAVARNGAVFIIDPRTGTSIGRTRVYAGVTSAPAASDDAMFVAGLDQSLWAFERRTGATRWRVRTEGKLTQGPVYHDGVVYAVLPKRGLAAVDAYTGDVIWENASITAPPVVKRGESLIVWDGSMAHVVQAVSGDIMDSVELPGVSRVTTNRFDGGDLYTVSVRDTEIRKHSPLN